MILVAIRSRWEAGREGRLPEGVDVGVVGRAVVGVAVAACWHRGRGRSGSAPSRPPSGDRVAEGQRKTLTTVEAPV